MNRYFRTLQCALALSTVALVGAGTSTTALAQAKDGAAEVNAALTDGFTAAEIDIVARWLTSIQDKFPRPSETRPSDESRE